MENKRDDDRFSNQSLLNMLARSQTSRTQSRSGASSSSSRSTATGQMTVSSKESNTSSSRRREKEVGTRERDTLSQQSSSTSRHSVRELSEKISNGANTYVSFPVLYSPSVVSFT